MRDRYGESLLERILAARWLVPRVKQHRFSLYATQDVQRVDQRILAGEVPPSVKETRRRRSVG